MARVSDLNVSASGYYGYGVFSIRVQHHPIASFITEVDAKLFADALNDDTYSTDYEVRAL